MVFCLLRWISFKSLLHRENWPICATATLKKFRKSYEAGSSLPNTSFSLLTSYQPALHLILLFPPCHGDCCTRGMAVRMDFCPLLSGAFLVYKLHLNLCWFYLPVPSTFFPFFPTQMFWAVTSCLILSLNLPCLNQDGSLITNHNCPSLNYSAWSLPDITANIHQPTETS
jgi:hypothetical protein